jgi:putative nucleotidyltransferase with HDIG domain
MTATWDTTRRHSGAGRVPGAETGFSIRVSELISALSYALDLTEGQPMGHSVRSCIIGMRLAKHLGLPIEQQGDLYYALLLKDAGCSSNSSKLFHILCADEIRAKRDVKLTDWTRVGWESLQYALTHVATGAPFLERVRTLVSVAARQQTESCELVKIRCERGASVARKMGFSESVSEAIHSLDEHWNGRGYPDGRKGDEIPLFSRILNLAQTLDVFRTSRGPSAAVDVALRRSKRWFDPDLVQGVLSLARGGGLWAGLGSEDVISRVVELEPQNRRVELTEKRLDDICLAFAEVIDAKSPFTYRHSNGVAEAAVGMARHLGLGEHEIVFLRRAALLHDVGKLGVSNAILEKPAKLDSDEWSTMKRHPYHSYEILNRISGFQPLAEIAASHHEKLDGTGYYRQLQADQLPLPVRVLVVADIFDALSAERPYRRALPLETVFRMLRKETPHALDSRCVEALAHVQQQSQSMAANLVEEPVAAT